jgi:hypothetical protein
MIVLQVRTTAESAWLAVGTLGFSAVSILLSALIAVLLVRGYRRGPGHTGMLALAGGLLLLTTVPEFLRIGLPTVTAVGGLGRSLLVSGCELAGLAAIIWAIYGGGSR